MTNDGLGVSFAPTREQSEMGERQGGLEGIPQAIRVLSLRLPRFMGARSPSPTVSGQGAQGMDPYLSAVFQTLAKTLGASMQPNAMTAPGLPTPGRIPDTNAGPNRGPVNVPGLPPSVPDTPWTPQPTPKTRTHWQDLPSGGGGQGTSLPTLGERLASKYDEPDMGFGGGRRF